MKNIHKIVFVLLFLLVACPTYAQQVQWASSVINYSSQLEGDSYSALQVLGEPNSMPAKGYSATAWATATDERKEFIHVGFEKPMRIMQVVIAENNAPGAVYKIVLFDTRNLEHQVYRQIPDTPTVFSRFFQVKFDETPYQVIGVKVFIDCRAVPGINQIDAIGISTNKGEVTSDFKVLTGLKVLSDVERLSDNINSKYKEVNPIISPDGKTLYFVRKNYPPYSERDKIWYSELNTRGDWQTAQFMKPPLMNRNHNSISSITPDGNTILLSHQYFSDSLSTGKGWSLSHKTSTGWSFPENQEIEGFANADRFFNCTMSNSGKVILMNVRRDDTRGSTDLYASFLQADASWSEPVNLGPVINSMGSECCAFIASDEKTLYFSSDGYNGYGSNDIYMSKRLDDSWKNWTVPANIGEPINSADWDAYYSISAKGDYAYFVRGTDIYRVHVAPEVQPDPVVLVYGTVYDKKTGKLVPDALIRYEYLKEGTEAGTARTSPDSGQYKIVLPYGHSYGFLAAAKGYLSVSDNLDVTDLKEYKEIRRDLYLVPLEVGEVVVIRNIFFDFAKAILKQESFSELNRLVQVLKNNPTMVIEIRGHTDNVGDDADNLKLSKDRANAVMQYLIEHGIDKSRMQTNGFGESQPVVTNDTDEGRAQNRRVEFKVLKR